MLWRSSVLGRMSLVIYADRNRKNMGLPNLQLLVTAKEVGKFYGKAHIYSIDANVHNSRHGIPHRLASLAVILRVTRLFQLYVNTTT